MRRIAIWAVCASIGIVLSGCGQNPSQSSETTVESAESAAATEAPQNEFGFMLAEEAGFFESPSANSTAQDEAQRIAADARRRSADPEQLASSEQAPKIAYSYAVGFRVDAEALQGFQQSHVDFCESLGADCRVLSLAQSGTQEYGYGTLELQVVASKAVGFSDQLRSSVKGTQAEQVSYAISGVDLTDNIIDTQARLTGRQVLRDRLMEVLRTRQGSVEELVEAERGVAEVNEEVDAAASRLAFMRTRVAFSNFSIEYSPEQGELRTGFWNPVSVAFASAGSVFGRVIAVIIYLLAAALPILISVFGLYWLWKRALAKWGKDKPEAE